MKVYGPYKRKDGRQHVIVYYEDGRQRTVSYPKFLMERHLGRELHPDKETIDHINNDFNDNRLENLRIIDRVSHSCTLVAVVAITPMVARVFEII